MRNKWLSVLTAFFVGLALCLAASTVQAEEIKVGGIMDTSGATSDVGKDYATGMVDAINWKNDQGGINGKKIDYTWFDYGYRVPEAQTKYSMLKRMGVVAVMGWGTADTEALSTTVMEDKIPYISASYSAHLTDPENSRYNAFAMADYSSAARAALTAWYDKKWPEHPDYGERKPRLGAFYMFASPYCSAPIKALKDQAKLLGFEIGPDQNVSLTALDTKSQIMAMKEFDPDVVWHSNTSMSAAATVKDAAALDLDATWILNIWAFNDNLHRLAGKAAEGVMGAAPCAEFGQDFKNMDMVEKAAKEYHPGTPLDERFKPTVQAWANALILFEALERADEAGEITGETILKEGLETMDSYEIGLGAAPVSFSAEDHRPTARVRVQEWKDGSFDTVEVVDLKKRWPKKWENEWLGY
ncbi:MAG: ABC transporter substrate-binding protein [Desulfohalobiaceae bacterium]